MNIATIFYGFDQKVVASSGYINYLLLSLIQVHLQLYRVGSIRTSSPQYMVVEPLSSGFRSLRSIMPHDDVSQSKTIRFKKREEPQQKY